MLSAQKTEDKETLQEEEKENEKGKIIKELLHLIKEVTCPICLSIVESPIMTPCNHLFCKECILRALRPRTNDDSQQIDTRPKYQTCPVCKAKCSARGLEDSPSVVGRLVERILAVREAFMQENDGMPPSQYITEAIKTCTLNEEESKSKENDDILIEIPSSTGEDVFRPVEEIIGPNIRPHKFDMVSYSSLNEIETQLVVPAITFNPQKTEQSGSIPSIENHKEDSTKPVDFFGLGLTSSPVIESKPELIAISSPEKNKSPKDPSRTTNGKRMKKRDSTTENISPKLKVTPKSSVLKSKRRKISVDSHIKSPLTDKCDKSSELKIQNTPSIHVTELVTSMLTKEKQATVLEFCEFFQVPLCHVFSQETCSHLIVSPTSGSLDNRLVAKRSFKYLQAKLSPTCKIVSIQWIEACLGNKELVPEVRFSINCDEETLNLLKTEKVKTRNGIGAPDLNAERIFEGKTFYFYGNYFAKPALSELISLCTMGGACIITNIAELKPGVIVLCDATESNFEKDAGIIERFKPILSTSWILDCISLGQIIKTVDPYIMI
jgi:hypothetical protein